MRRLLRGEVRPNERDIQRYDERNPPAKELLEHQRALTPGLDGKGRLRLLGVEDKDTKAGVFADRGFFATWYFKSFWDL